MRAAPRIHQHAPPRAASRTSHKDVLFAHASIQQQWEYVNSLDGTAISNAVVGWRIRGPLEFHAAHRALDEIVARHEVLRTYLTEIDNQVVQAIVPAAKVVLGTCDLREGAPRRRGRALTRWIKQQLCDPIRLDVAPQLRAQLFRAGPTEHILLLVVPHAIWDAASSHVFIREFVMLHSALVSGGSVRLDDAELQYADLAEWQHATATRVGPSAPHHETARRRRAALRRCDCGPLRTNVRGTSIPEVTASAVDLLEGQARREGATLPMALVAALAALLHTRVRFSGLEIGVVTANRGRPELKDVIGYVASVMPIPVEVKTGVTFTALLRGVRDTMLAIYDAEATDLTTPHPPARRRLSAPSAACDVLFNYIPADTPSSPVDPLGRLSVEPYLPVKWRSVADGATEWESSAFDFTVGPLRPTGRHSPGVCGLHGRLAFDSNLVTLSDAEALATDFVRLLRLLALRPQMPVDAIRDRLTKINSILHREGLAWTRPDSGLIIRGA